jgi:hypothetical protein
MGRRCTNCGGLMVTPDEYQKVLAGNTAYSSSTSTRVVSQDFIQYSGRPMESQPVMVSGSMAMPALVLFNSTLNIRIEGVNGAVIGRRQGPYVQFFQNNMYVSGVHAQLKYNATTGWSITDKHSSNGTKLNEHPLQPDVEMSIKNGDIVTIANVNLKVSVS